MSIKYSDGSSVESQIIRKLKSLSDVEVNELSFKTRSYSEWAEQYHLTPERGNLVRPFNFEGLDVLELGAGMGGVSRHIAETCRHLDVVEGTEARVQALSQRLRTLNNWSAKVSNISDFQTTKAYDVVCVIGVIEYTELYWPAHSEKTCFHSFLKKAKSFLKPGGVVLLAIENKFGLKYWSGAPEDHTNRLNDGILGYRATPTPRTFSRNEWLNIFNECGFEDVQSYYPFPDYKIPSSIISSDFIKKDSYGASMLANSRSFESYTLRRSHRFNDLLASISLAESGMFEDFANSFLFLASVQKGSETLKKLESKRRELSQVAWYYNFVRAQPTQTVFCERHGSIEIEKTLLGQHQVSRLDSPLTWERPESSKLSTGRYTYLRHKFLRSLIFGTTEDFVNDLKNFLKAALEEFTDPTTGKLAPSAFDAVFTNAYFNAYEEYEFFDLEWSYKPGLDSSYFILRNVLQFHQDRYSFSATFPMRTIKDLYQELCRRLSVTSNFERDLETEVTIQSLVNPHRPKESIRRDLSAMFTTPFVLEVVQDYILEDHAKWQQRHLLVSSFSYASHLTRSRIYSRFGSGPFAALLGKIVDIGLKISCRIASRLLGPGNI